MGNQAQASELVPRIVPTPRWIRAVSGQWKVDGEIVRMAREPDTGVLVAIDEHGNSRNPLRVISNGAKVKDPDPDDPGP